jgi:Zn-dependent M28 family amino/carboxypeptidase
LGFDVEYHVWDRDKYPNVIGELRGESTPEDIYIICAHLDDAPFEGVAPGADDNASSSAAVLIAPDILSRHRWDSTLRFILFTGEEQWSMDESYAHGSSPYARRSRERGENIVAVLNLDMLGWNSEGKPEPALDLLQQALVSHSTVSASNCPQRGHTIAPSIRQSPQMAV